MAGRKRRAPRTMARASKRGLKLGLDMSETALAASSVIGHRMLRIATATPARKRPDPELTRMIQEKVDAVQEAGARVARTAARQRPAASAQAQLDAAFKLGQAWLAPFRTRVRRNAKRLGGKGKR